MADTQPEQRASGDRRQVERRRFPRHEVEFTDRRVAERRSGQDRRGD